MNKKYIFFGIGGMALLLAAYFFIYKQPFWKKPLSGSEGRATSTLPTNPGIKTSAVSQKIIFTDNCGMRTEPLTLIDQKLVSLENNSKAGNWVSVLGNKFYLLPNSKKVIVLNASTTKATMPVYCGAKLETVKEFFIK